MANLMLKLMLLKNLLDLKCITTFMSQCFKRNGLDGVKVDPFYKWNTKSTYINKPPYWEDEYMQMPALKI